MSTNNKVFQVLVTKGNKAPLAKDLQLGALTPGQIGIFDYNTNQSIDGTTPVKDFYIAVGVDAKNINFSAGQVIQKENVRDYTFRPHTAGAPQIIEITDYIVNCETDYALKFEFRNSQIYARQGYNQFTKTFNVRTECCGCDTSCPSGSAVELTKKLFHVMNDDADGMFKVEAIVAAGGAVIPDIDAFAANPLNVDATPGLRITVNGLAVNDFSGINATYYNAKQTVIIPSLVDGFNCTGKITTTQEATSEEGNGYDIKQKEYFAGGWNGRPGPYRTSSVTGMESNAFLYFTDAAVKYDQINLIYDQFSTSGWGEYLNNLLTLIAIPETDTVTRNGFMGFMDAILANAGRGFDALADDAATASVDPVVVEKTKTKAKDKDGIA